ncbi:MAG TPA: sugar ABC transporter substrate-binding protein [Candidatus Limnocylindria bacterium]|nr:sugar ABC transporter substrate-binding protein [Candidatus Limnocylindria bacterium]
MDSTMTPLAHTRRLLLASAPAVAGALAAACAGIGDQTGGAAQRRPVTVAFLTNWAGGTRLETLQKALPEFQRQFPHITVDFQYKDEGMRAMIIAQAAANTLAHVALGAGQFFHEFVNRGYLFDISPTLKKLKVDLNDYTLVPGVADFEGKRYGMPFQLQAIIWAYNKTMFDRFGVKPPTTDWTWNELLEAAQALTRAQEQQWGVLMFNGLEMQWGPLVYSNGQDWISADFKKTLLDQPPAIEAAQFAVDLIHRYRVSPTTEERTQYRPGLTAGNIGMAVTGAGLAATIRTQNPAFELDYFPTPIAPRTRRRVAMVSDQPHWAMSSAKDRPEEATQLLLFLSGEYTQGLITDLRGTTPVLKKLQTSDRYLSPPPATMKLLVDAFAYTKPMPFHAKFTPWFDAITEAMNPAFNGQQQVPDALKEATRLADQVLAEPMA